MAFESHLASALVEYCVDFPLKAEQLQALRSLYEGKDTVCLLRTGYGKSLIYQLSPFLMGQKWQTSQSTTLVISPLNSIMQDQVIKLASFGIKACYLDMCCHNGETFEFMHSAPTDDHVNDSSASEYSEDSFEEQIDTDDDSFSDSYGGCLKVSVPLSDIEKGEYRIVYGHPEAFLTAPEGRKLLQRESFKQQICCVAIDEAHMLTEWGDNFRKAFSRLQDILALCPRAPALILTATASPTTQQKIIKDPALKDPTLISVHPDRPNIIYYKKERSPSHREFDDLDVILQPIVQGLKEQGQEYPQTIMYADLHNIAYIFRYLEAGLKEHQYVGEAIPENRLFGMYHQCYTKVMKQHIVHELEKTTSKVRFVAATGALGMGLDAPSIRRIIHFGSPNNVEKYIQETGLAGRDGKQSEAVLYYNATDMRANRPGQQQAMVSYCRSENVCLRSQLLNFLNFDAPKDRVMCACCQTCKTLCQSQICK